MNNIQRFIDYNDGKGNQEVEKFPDKIENDLEWLLPLMKRQVGAYIFGCNFYVREVKADEN